VATPPAEGAAVLQRRGPGRSDRARTGKIARLPNSLREELNQRLRDDLPASEILPWLNGLPEVRRLLESSFEGSAISEHTLSRWRRGGYACWLQLQEAQEAVGIAAGTGRAMDQADRDALTDHLARVVSARMVLELQKFEEMPESPLKTAAWKELVWSLVLLRRSEFYAGKLRLERDKLPLRKAAQDVTESAQEQNESYRMSMSLGGPSWNNFTQQWEGEGADEMREKEEVGRMVLAELRRRQAERQKTEGQTGPSDQPTTDCTDNTDKGAS